MDEPSILGGVKKILGIGDDDTSFDFDILTHLNSVFSDLQQLGVGDAGFQIPVNQTDIGWELFATNQEDRTELVNLCKSFVYLKVRMLFDPPTNPPLLSAMEKQIEQFEWRINVLREATGWSDPMPVVVVEEPI